MEGYKVMDSKEKATERKQMLEEHMKNSNKNMPCGRWRNHSMFLNLLWLGMDEKYRTSEDRSYTTNTKGI